MTKEWRKFERARDFARTLNLKNWHQWMRTPRPEDVPSEPFKVYQDQWNGWRDWLGTDWRSFEEARAFVRGLKLKNYEEWQEYCKSGMKPINIPHCPMSVYEGQYRGIADWLGTIWLPFDPARDFVHKLDLNGQVEWRKYCKSGEKPENIPSTPNVVYRDEWVSWPDWVGTLSRKQVKT